jgi:alcohol dehydrogenase (cytochrome c)
MKRAIACTAAALGAAALSVAAQPPPGQGGRGGGAGGAFPKRPAADPAVLERGKALYGVNCQFCHGADTRGGDAGPSLLRSQLVQDDRTGELIAPGFLQSFDPETGELQWKLYMVPMKEGDPGLNSWKSLDAARHGGAQVWVPGSYDPETHLYITGTGNPTPAYTSQTRGEGDNLYTCSLIAVNVDTGRMQWYYQTSQHDTHDWDSAQTPMLVDAPFGGRMRKLVLTAARNGYYFTLDRVTGEHLVTGKFSDTVNWTTGVNAKGQPVRDPKKDYDIAGALVSSANGGAANWPPASFSPDTGFLAAIDYKTGKVAWKQPYPTVTGAGGGGNGLLTTAGRLLFAADAGGNFVARDPANGRPLWHARIGNVSNAPETYMLDGRQYVLVAAGDTLYAFTINQ